MCCECIADQLLTDIYNCYINNYLISEFWKPNSSIQFNLLQIVVLCEQISTAVTTFFAVIQLVTETKRECVQSFIMVKLCFFSADIWHVHQISIAWHSSCLLSSWQHEFYLAPVWTTGLFLDESYPHWLWYAFFKITLHSKLALDFFSWPKTVYFCKNFTIKTISTDAVVT